MKKVFFLLALWSVSNLVVAQDAQQLIAEMIEAMGGKENFYNQGSVSYQYEYHNSDPTAPLHLAGTETYVFDGELSRAEYTQHSILGAAGKVIEGYDGQEAWVSLNGQISDDKQANGVARFLRKTNYYWFAMFFKMQDEGVNLSYEGNTSIEGRKYDLVKVTFGNQVGDAQDTYVLYINQRTKLVDQFLFTVIGFGVTEPNLMKVQYETINGLRIPSDRVYTKANWEGEILSENWVTTTWSNIQFGKEINRTIFAKK